MYSCMYYFLKHHNFFILSRGASFLKSTLTQKKYQNTHTNKLNIHTHTHVCNQTYISFFSVSVTYLLFMLCVYIVQASCTTAICHFHLFVFLVHVLQLDESNAKYVVSLYHHKYNQQLTSTTVDVDVEGLKCCCLE